MHLYSSSFEWLKIKFFIPIPVYGTGTYGRQDSGDRRRETGDRREKETGNGKQETGNRKRETEEGIWETML